MRLRSSALLLLAGLLAGCAPTHEWVNPAVPLAMRGEDAWFCQSEAAYLARRNYWWERDRLWFDAHMSRSPGLRAHAYSRLQHLDMYESLDRSRYFEHCMRARGYALQPIVPREPPRVAPAAPAPALDPASSAQPKKLDD
jgi:hypothetical protein